MSPYVRKGFIKFNYIAYVNFLWHLFAIRFWWMYHMIHNGLHFTDFVLLRLRSSTMNLSTVIQVSDLLILSNYLLCNYLHSANKCILDYLTKLWYHARIMQERELGEKIYFCIDTSFFLYSYTTLKGCHDSWMVSSIHLSLCRAN